MELRQLTTPTERQHFARRLTEVRMMKGAGFSETQRSVVGEVHLAYGKLYGLFDENLAGGEMIGGFAMHDLAMFSQSYPKPDLTHLPPESVFECGELWAVAAGAGRLIRHGGAIIANELGARALLVYPILKPWNLSHGYPGFERIGEPTNGLTRVRSRAGKSLCKRWLASARRYSARSERLKNTDSKSSTPASGFAFIRRSEFARNGSTRIVCFRRRRCNRPIRGCGKPHNL